MVELKHIVILNLLHRSAPKHYLFSLFYFLGGFGGLSNGGIEAYCDFESITSLRSKALLGILNSTTSITKPATITLNQQLLHLASFSLYGPPDYII
jgi:hypothetical protein